VSHSARRFPSTMRFSSYTRVHSVTRSPSILRFNSIKRFDSVTRFPSITRFSSVMRFYPVKRFPSSTRFSSVKRFYPVLPGRIAMHGYRSAACAALLLSLFLSTRCSSLTRQLSLASENFPRKTCAGGYLEAAGDELGPRVFYH
jgi:hypothetical protein